ncbi:tRNA preQ1(34) S-adenosylmethionine ribosyltransferase-isomerase QueA [filamentous cyanobacterium LEGE 11480]|uniref:S-adenosylmethionine:tRNA ribosyltransferase-isomerase n=1 Tax=Romeriopsis navalis LEGE 11480 TaxID=2777977 RepID=A0A928VQ50_9CYAN|nr:tRNA preQ1(34) S-adenosylmethionine ribosyltransferase-isomerase QueA [Romeriopsis navalis LEGE 11480]
MPTADQQLSAYDYALPTERIAQTPAVPRDTSRLLVIHDSAHHCHQHFHDLPNWLQPGDLLVLNNTRVIPARLHGIKVGGAKVEVLLLEEKTDNQWLALVKPGRRLKPGAVIEFIPLDMAAPTADLRAEVLASDAATGGRLLKFMVKDNRRLLEVIDRFGTMPLPPYITGRDSTPEQYQTVYADRDGSAAAPTAGLHFTPQLFEQLDRMGVQRAFVTLHVGVGTFRPVETEDITQHQMHGEWIEVSSTVVEQIEQTKAKGGRVIAVGTTSVRSLEGAANANPTGKLLPFCGKTDMFIYPGYKWRVVDGLITNFHLPKSSLMMLVSALIGRERLLALYQEAIDLKYRFFSFGDAMLILPETPKNTFPDL